MILLPIGALAWAGSRMARDEQVTIQRRFEDLMVARLRDVDRGIQLHFAQLERQLQLVTQIDDYDVTAMREVVRRDPWLLQLFVIDADGSLLYPNPAESLNGNEQSFLLRASRMFTDRDLINTVQQDDARESGRSDVPVVPRAEPAQRAAASATVPGESPKQQATIPAAAAPLPVRTGWFVWYWDRGQNLIYWQRRPSGHVVGAALERARWMADLVAALPETETRVDIAAVQDQSAVRLLNSQGEVVYQWGSSDELSESERVCEIAVSAPLTSWRLQCPASVEALTASAQRSVLLNLLGGLVAAAAALCGLGTWLYRDYSRDMRNAAQQVSFVNQVSHELKAPLTNIRMYAELLENDLTEVPDAAGCRRRVAVITSEAQRLSRLISNVLTFARQERQSLEPSLQTVELQSAIERIVDRYRPSLESHGMTITVESDEVPPAESGLSSGTSGTAVVDPDFLEQILGNLINNVERYAADGRRLDVRWRITRGAAEVDVMDFGPGIPANRREDVFRPFVRLNNSVDQPAGTGIGLSIARNLARLQGGDLVLLPSKSGCHFRLTIPHPS